MVTPDRNDSMDGEQIRALLERLGGLAASREHPEIWVRRVSDEQLLAMKLDAMRDDVDRADAIVVATRLGLARASTELAIAPYVLPARYMRVCEELEEIWQEVEDARR